MVVRWLCCVYGSWFCQCSDHCYTGICHRCNLTLSTDLTGFRVLCRGIDSTDDDSVIEDSDGSSLMGSKNDGSSGDNSLMRGRGVSGWWCEEVFFDFC